VLAHILDLLLDVAASRLGRVYSGRSTARTAVPLPRVQGKDVSAATPFRDAMRRRSLRTH